mgnify:CR=1 FL=1
MSELRPGMPAGIWRRRRLAPHHIAGYAGRAFLTRPAERFERNGFDNLSVICFANATVSLRLSHGAGLTAHRAVIQHRAAASLPCEGEASRCGGDIKTERQPSNAVAFRRGRRRLQIWSFRRPGGSGTEQPSSDAMPARDVLPVSHSPLFLWRATPFPFLAEKRKSVRKKAGGQSRPPLQT